MYLPNNSLYFGYEFSKPKKSRVQKSASVFLDSRKVIMISYLEQCKTVTLLTTLREELRS